MNWEQRLAAALHQSHVALYDVEPALTPHQRSQMRDREQLLLEWTKQQQPKPSWRRVLCLIFDAHRYPVSTWNQPCIDCHAPRPKEPLQ